MLDVYKIRKDFPILQGKTMQGHPLAYLDNGATTLKPYHVIDSISEYLGQYSGNAHRGDYDLSAEVDQAYEGSRKKVAQFINAKSEKEIVFTSGATDSLNMIAFGYVYNHIEESDEILITVAEHAANVIPWFKVSDAKGAIVKYIDLDSEGKVTIENVKKAITPKTKYISLAHLTNVLGYDTPIKEITKLAHENNIIVIVDGAQSVPHLKTNVIDLDVDFLVFSGHKMCGPTGIGVLYGKYDLLEGMEPIRYGGGSNSRFYANGDVSLQKVPTKFEAGTPNIEGAIGLGAAIDYLNSIGMENVHQYELELRNYAVKELKKLDNVIIYNENGIGPITFNLKNVFAQDVASLFNHEGIAVRAGQHCAKLLDHFLPVKNTLRVSLYFYNTIEEVDRLVKACQDGDDFLKVFF